ncbi:unnamed protein product, partial [Mesorhabditis belari]|uniref:Uncharacterized protein n=1 Tax=Mesorhabditis belari TaxID=2138241 RepID=A0AAF3ED19_9BILA
MIIPLFICIFFFELVQSNVPFRRKTGKTAGYPVVIIPGDAGSQLEANLTGKPTVVHYVCSKQTQEYFDLWLNLESFSPIVIDCWLDNMKLVYNSSSGFSSNMPGVDVRVPGMGDTSTVEWLDPSNASTGSYFFTMVDMMATWGYRRGKSVVAAPYDWRKSPVENRNYFLLLKSLIELTYKYNQNTKVVILAHSMGNPAMLYFYKNFVDQDWKDKYIQSHVSLAAAWGGSMQIVRLMISGYNMNYYRIILAPSKLREMQRSFTSSAFLFPSNAVWKEDEVLAVGPEKNYTLKNVQEMFNDSMYPIGWDQYQKHSQLLGDLEAPGVEIHCIYGIGLDTPDLFTWTKGWFPDYVPYVQYGDGDGTVNRRSGEVCTKWNQNNNKGKKVTIHALDKTEHMAIMQSPAAIELVRKALYGEL